LPRTTTCRVISDGHHLHPRPEYRPTLIELGSPQSFRMPLFNGCHDGWKRRAVVLGYAKGLTRFSVRVFFRPSTPFLGDRSSTLRHGRDPDQPWPWSLPLSASEEIVNFYCPFLASPSLFEAEKPCSEPGYLVRRIDSPFGSTF